MLKILFKGQFSLQTESSAWAAWRTIFKVLQRQRETTFIYQRKVLDKILVAHAQCRSVCLQK